MRNCFIKSHGPQLISRFTGTLTKKHLFSPYSTLTNLLVISNDFIQAEIVYGHIIWLMYENGYEETSASVQEFTVHLEEIKSLAKKQRKMGGEQ